MSSALPTAKYQAYAAATQTVAKTKQIVMLYDGAIRFMQQARQALVEQRIEDRYNLLIRAASVVNGLQGCLDFDKGGDIAKVLYSFYSSVENKIFSIHHSRSLETCDEVISDLKQMRDVWEEIDRGLVAQEGNTPSTPPSLPATTGEAPNVTLSA